MEKVKLKISEETTLRMVRPELPVTAYLKSNKVNADVNLQTQFDLCGTEVLWTHMCIYLAKLVKMPATQHAHIIFTKE